jgi:hypothetical protein
MRMVERIHKGTVLLLGRLGLLCDETGFPEPDRETETPAMAELYEASVRQMLTTGPRAGQKPLRLRSAASVPPGEKTGKRSARAGGFDLYATKAIPKDRRERLEKVCRYLLRPPIPQECLEYKGKLAILRLSAPRSEGTTHLCFEPRELVEKLSAMVPRPRTNLLLYQGVLSGNAFMRDRVIRFGEPPLLSTRIEKPRPRRPNATWAELMKRGLQLDVLSCPRCGHRMKYLATIFDREVIREILEQPGELKDEVASVPPARAPPVKPPTPKEPTPLALRLSRLRDSVVRG